MSSTRGSVIAWGWKLRHHLSDGSGDGACSFLSPQWECQLEIFPIVPTARKDGRAAYPRSSTAIGTKAKGRFLLRDLALSVPIFGDPGRLPDHNSCIPESLSTHEPKPAVSSLFHNTLAAKAFHYHPSPVAWRESRCRFSKMAVSPLSPLEDHSSVESNTTLHQRKC